MRHHRLTRRQALGAGATALAAGALRPRGALAAGRSSVFELTIAEGDGAVAAGWRTTRVLRAPRRFDLVGLRWSAGSVRAEVRARRRGGSWGPWLPLPAAGDHGPDGGDPVQGTEPAYTGAADHFQLRLSGHARGLRARFVHAEPAARVARAAARRSARTARAAAAPRARRQVAPPPIIPRAAWGGDLVPPRDTPSYGQVQVAFVHHTAGTTAYTPEQSAAIVLAIGRYHRNSNGWDDIGYNFLVDQFGQVFEGRAGGIDQAVVGAQAQGYNAVSTGIAILGTYEGAPPTPQALDAVARLIGWKLSLHGVPVAGPVTVISSGGAANRYPAGTAVTLERVSGHRDGDKTSCPGAALYAQLPALRQLATRYTGPLGGITMRADSGTTLRHPKPLVLTGWLRQSDGFARGGATVTVEFQAPGGPWTPIGQAVTDGNGQWRMSVALPGSGTVRAVFAEQGLVSPLLSVGVVPRLTLVPASPRVLAGRRFAVTGEFAPATPGQRAAVLVERRERRGYRRAAARTVAVRGARYGVRVRLRRAGLYRISVRVGGRVVRRFVRVL